MPKREDILRNVQTNLHAFQKGKLAENAKALLNTLEYDSDKTYDLSPNTYQGFFEDFAKHEDGFDPDNAKADEWLSADILFQVADEDLNQGQSNLFIATALQKDRYNSLLFMAIELRENHYTRTDLAKITREVNKCFLMPVIILFKYGAVLTLSVIERRQNKREAEKDVLEKVTLVKDVGIASPHRAHLEILTDLSLDELADRKKHRISNFDTLFKVWQEALDTTELNKRFYKELSNWYFWAKSQAQFPTLPHEKTSAESDERVSTAMIRLITRLIFVWFLKEKNLVPEELFDKTRVNGYLDAAHQVGGTGDSYYKAILQNLFFATLNTEMNQYAPNSRGFKQESKKGQSYNTEYMTHTRYRYRSYFKNADAALELFQDVPFLNGGLFECLDKAATDSASGKEERIDGFSDKAAKTQASVPDALFFGEDDIDLNDVYGTKNKRPEHVLGILRIFERYKFTIDENTPIEEEVALDPELLGKVFENLLASYNPETQTTARKQTGSFYTPREIVNYMVDESLIAYLTGKLTEKEIDEDKAQEKLRQLFAYSEAPHEFTESEVTTLIAAIDALKILDPACGSGAFPMGVLLRLVEILGQLDPNNEHWKEQQRERVIGAEVKRIQDDIKTAEKISYEQAREKAIHELDERLKEIRAAFEENDHNYARKLFLIENCIYGVDIQPVAVQIAKLRFFVSLIVDQRVKEHKPNRGILALPNLETKFVAANTLLSLEIQSGIWASTKEIKKKEEELAQVRHDHFNARTFPKKKKLRKQDEKIRDEIRKLLEQGGVSRSAAQQLSNWNPYEKNARADFFDLEWMFGLSQGFNIVIGNPPYGVAFTKEEKKYFTQNYRHQDYQLDSYLLFLERSFDFLVPNGFLAYIIPNTWLTNLKLRKIRKFVVDKQTIQTIVHYGKKVFDAVVDNEVVLITKGATENQIVSIQVVDEDSILKNAVPQKKWKQLKGDPVNIFLTEKDEKILFALEASSTLLEDICDVAAGMSPYEVGKGKPPQTREMLKKRIYDATYQKDDTYRPLLRGRDIEKYLIKWDGTRWVKYGDNLAAPRRLSNFDAPEKIVIRQTGDSLIAALDNSQFICMKNMHTINRKNGKYKLPYLLALINSTLMNYYFQSLNPEKGETLAEVKKEHVAKLPIFKATPVQQQVFVLFVNYVNYLKECLNGASGDRLSSTNRSKHVAIVSYFERILNGMVYELYLPDELHKAGRHIIKHVEAEKLPELESIEGDKLAALQGIFERLYAKDHPVRENLYFLNSVEAVRTIEGKA